MRFAVNPALVVLAALAARGKSLASHRDGRGASPARRDDREYREYLSEEQRSRRGCIARRMQPDFHHGLLRADGILMMAVRRSLRHEPSAMTGACDRVVTFPVLFFDVFGEF